MSEHWGEKQKQSFCQESHTICKNEVDNNSTKKAEGTEVEIVLDEVLDSEKVQLTLSLQETVNCIQVKRSLLNALSSEYIGYLFSPDPSKKDKKDIASKKHELLANYYHKQLLNSNKVLSVTEWHQLVKKECFDPIQQETSSYFKGIEWDYFASETPRLIGGQVYYRPYVN